MQHKESAGSNPAAATKEIWSASGKKLALFIFPLRSPAKKS
jgi:hypothetical protein